MITAARTAIYTLLKTVTDLGVSNVYFQEAPQATADPYCVFMEADQPSERDTGNYYDDIFLQITVYSKTLATIETIISNVKTAFDVADLTITGYVHDGINRVSTLTAPQDEEGFYSENVIYRIQLTEN